MTSTDFLVEIGTEELPPKNLRRLSEAFLEGLVQGLQAAGLDFEASRAFATPRRLAVVVDSLDTMQAEQVTEKRGPAIKAAFDADGEPTKAALGFARGCGVAVTDLGKVTSEQGEWLAYTLREAGKPASELLPQIVEKALEGLPVAKRMRWGASSHEFVRPVQWVVLMQGEQTIPATIFGHSAGRETRGHRFMGEAQIEIEAPSAYEEALRERGRVIASYEDRKALIRDQVESAAATVGGTPVMEESLLEEVTALVEWPAAVCGNFEERFLDVPQEVLVSTMSDNQKYFHIVDQEGAILPHFITISNIESKDPVRVQDGNERVIRPRFADAEFFFNQDRKQSLASRREKLSSLVYQAKLGNVLERTDRITSLTRWLGEQTHSEVGEAVRAAELCKCDLLTEMVQEFPKLQGIMGRYYAEHDGEGSAVANAIEEHYRPRHAQDALPASHAGMLVAIAERLDTLTGIFGIGRAPTGEKDPFGLRRAALGILRILIEKQVSLNLVEAVGESVSLYPEGVVKEETGEETCEFLFSRLRAYYRDQGIPVEVFNAVLAIQPTDPLEFDQRVHAVQAFTALPEAASLAAANKRVSNILEKTAININELQVKEALLEAPEEQRLFAEIEELGEQSRSMLEARSFDALLRSLAGLREPVDSFFDQVMVNCEDEGLRNNRLALLNRLRQLFLEVADVSLLPSI